MVYFRSNKKLTKYFTMRPSYTEVRKKCEVKKKNKSYKDQNLQNREARI